MHDLAVIRDPYVALGIVVVVMFVVIALVKMPAMRSAESAGKASVTLKRLFSNKEYREGVVAQVFYVATQIMTWTFIIQYADNLGINKATAQNCNIGAMCMFLCFRFGGTAAMRYIRPAKLLAIFGVCAGLCTLGAIFIVGIAGLVCLVAVSAFMSIMFPSIYGIALEKVSNEDASLGAAFLVMAIVGGALMPPLQGMIIDMGSVAGLPAVNFSFILPFVCFCVITVFALRCTKGKI